MQLILPIAIGGAIGAVLRFLISRYIGSVTNTAFPIGTFIINLSGSFIIGFLYTLFEKIISTPEIRAFLLIGLIGSFTTFSTYILETFNLFRDKEFIIGFLNIFLSQICGLLSLFIGIIIARIVLLGKF
ncbi:MAG: fluoride efflux transporter CrcB [Exilispira sp.]